MVAFVKSNESYVNIGKNVDEEKGEVLLLKAI